MFYDETTGPVLLLFFIQTDKLQPNRDTVFFRDGVRRIDFVLSYVDDKDERKQVSRTQKWHFACQWPALMELMLLLHLYPERNESYCNEELNSTRFKKKKKKPADQSSGHQKN